MSEVKLKPGDYMVLHPGLRIENTSGNMFISVEIGRYTVEPIIYENLESKSPTPELTDQEGRE